MKIALIAHDKKKDAMIELAIKYQDTLAQHELYAPFGVFFILHAPASFTCTGWKASGTPPGSAGPK